MKLTIRFALAIVAFCIAIPAHANLLVAPTRVIFEDNLREAEILLVNKGSAEASYRLSFINNRQLPSGSYERITSPTSPTGEAFAEKLVRFSPRQVTIKPGQTQIVRVSLRKPAGLAPGEYRSHLLFQKIPDQTPITVDPKKKLQISVNMVPGVSIPIIVRQGATASRVTIGKPALHFTPGQRGGTLKLPLRRQGTRSVFGNFTVVYQAANDLESVSVGVLNHVSMLTPGTDRYVTIPIELPPNVSSRGTFQIDYRSAEPTSSGNLLATRDFTVQ